MQRAGQDPRNSTPGRARPGVPASESCRQSSSHGWLAVPASSSLVVGSRPSRTARPTLPSTRLEPCRRRAGSGPSRARAGVWRVGRLTKHALVFSSQAAGGPAAGRQAQALALPCLLARERRPARPSLLVPDGRPPCRYLAQRNAKEGRRGSGGRDLQLRTHLVNDEVQPGFKAENLGLACPRARRRR